jgi:hypothetical protein
MNDVWVERIKAFGAIVDQMMRYIGPLMLTLSLWLQAQVRDDVVDTKKEVTTTAKIAASNAAVAAKKADVATDTLNTSRDERAQQIEKVIAELEENKRIAELNLKHWKAYNTKDPQDMAEASRMTEAVLERSTAAAPQSQP